MTQPDTVTGYTDTQKELLAIRNNDEKALQHFYQTNYPKVEKYVLANSGSVDEARDIFQEAFIATWRNIQLDRFTAERGIPLGAYLFSIAKNKWIDSLRALKRKQQVSFTEDTDDVMETEDLSETEQLQLHNIKANFGLLGESCRDILIRFYYQDQSMRKISEAMKWTEATARNNKYRCLQRLRELMKNNKP